MSGFHRPGRHCSHQAQSAVRCPASPRRVNCILLRSTCEANLHMADSFNELIFFPVWPFPETAMGVLPVRGRGKRALLLPSMNSAQNSKSQECPNQTKKLYKKGFNLSPSIHKTLQKLSPVCNRPSTLDLKNRGKTVMPGV